MRFTVPKVSCAFYDSRNREVIADDIEISTTLGPFMLEARDTCLEHARSKGHPMFAHPDGREGSDMWLAYCVDGRLARYVRAFPSRSAAEMWMIHHG